MVLIRSAIRPLRSFGRGHKPQVVKKKIHPVTGMHMNKNFGQHILKEQGIVDKIVAAAQIEPFENVLEIGPGTGNLTMKLLPKCRHLTAIECDSRMVTEVTRRAAASGFGKEKLSVIEGNCLDTVWPRFDTIVANLPYNITAPFLFKFLMQKHKWRAAVLMVEQETAFKLLADPGADEFTRMSLNVRLYARILRVCEVKSGAFFPAPMVQSQVIKVVPRANKPDIDFEEWDAMIRNCMRFKRKAMKVIFRGLWLTNMLEANYKTWCSIHNVSPAKVSFKKMVLDTISEAELAYHKPIELDIPVWVDLLERFHRKGIHFVNVSDPEGSGKKQGRKSQRRLHESPSINAWDDDDVLNRFHEPDGTISISN